MTVVTLGSRCVLFAFSGFLTSCDIATATITNRQPGTDCVLLGKTYHDAHILFHQRHENLEHLGIVTDS